MRKHLLDVFDKIYILDLHGNAKKKEKAPDGSKDENVFDIMQGVSINIFVKNGKKKHGKLADVFHSDLFGKRSEKYKFLRKSTLRNVEWQKLKFCDENYFFVPKEFELKDKYENGFKIDELFMLNSSGITTQRDDASIKFTQEECDKIKNDIVNLSNHELSHKYGFVDVRDWTISEARKDLQNNDIIANKIQYRPFDFRFMNYIGKTKGIMGYPRYGVMQHFIKHENIGLITSRQQSTFDFQHAFVTNYISDRNSISMQTKEATYVFPLYRNETDLLNTSRTPNLNRVIIENIAQTIKLEFESEKSNNTKKFAPVDILDYIYAVLHSPAYREKYKEFLKIDFPRIPYPESAKQFRKLSKLGEKLRHLHLLEDVEPKQGIADYPIPGDNKIEKITYSGDKVYINQTQYFAKVSTEAWNFYIGGYQPAQKWLKDRKGRELSYEDIQHYRRVVLVLRETGRVMGEIGEVES
jgi:predicted helicase